MNILDIREGDAFVRSNKSVDIVIRRASVEYSFIGVRTTYNGEVQDWSQGDVNAALGPLNWKLHQHYSNHHLWLPIGA